MYTLEIGTEIRDFVVTNFLFGKGEDLSNEESLLENGVIDSTGVLELVSYLQERFEIRIEDDEIVPANLDSIHNLVDYVGRKTGR
jgi:acyl carrier protein